MEAPEPVVDAVHMKSLNPGSSGASMDSSNKLRFAVATMVSIELTFSTYKQLIARISRDVGRDGAFVVRPSYKEVRLALTNGQVDLALVCTGTYLRGGGRQKL